MTMPLREQLQRQGEWLFRWRSILPMLLLPLLVLAFIQYSYPGGTPRGESVWEVICAAVSTLGLALRVYAAGTVPRRTSGRNTRKGQVADSLNTTGLYSIVRHPLYLANYLVALGLVIFFHLWWFAAAYTVLFWLYYERIMFAEEEFLRRKFGNHFTTWAARTPLLIPRLANWHSPNLPFSWKTALKREYQTVFLTIASFTVFETISDSLLLNRFCIEPAWLALFGLAVVSFVAVRLLRTQTHILRVNGR
jgi:protein-S-isoprenylcysteine O-methyltransferase Ste14